MPFQSTPLCSANRLSSIETIASFIVLAIWSLGTSNRRCEYSHAMTLPLASTIVETRGHLALDELSRAVSNHIGGPVRHQSEAADDRETSNRRPPHWPTAAPRQLDDRDRRRRSVRRALRHALQSN